MLNLLEHRGILSNPLVVATSDNGMPFPRVKGQAYDDSDHMPLAVQWPEGIRNPGRIVTDYVSFIDFAPTFLELAGITEKQVGMAPIAGRSLNDIFRSAKSGQACAVRDHVIIGRERNDVGRPHDWGYRVRGVVKNDLLYLHNFEPARWPSGNPETGYTDCGGSPTKTETLKTRLSPKQEHRWELSFGLRGAEELYDLRRDPNCLKNVAGDAAFRAETLQLRVQLFSELQEQADPRVLGRGQIFDEYPFASDELRGFYECYLRGEKLDARWIDDSDVEPLPLPRTR